MKISLSGLFEEENQISGNALLKLDSFFIGHQFEYFTSQSISNMG